MCAVKINILKTDIHDIGFNQTVFAANVKSLLPEIDAGILDAYAVYLAKQIAYEEQFKKISNDALTLMQLVSIGYVIADDTEQKVLVTREDTYVGEGIRVRAERIVRGIIKNYPPNVDLLITKVANDKYGMANLDDIDGLLRQSLLVDNVIKYQPYLYKGQPAKIKELVYVPKEIKVPFASNKYFDVANKYVAKEYSTSLNFSNLHIFMQQVVSAKLAEVLFSSSGSQVNAVISRLINNNSYDRLNLALSENRYRVLNDFNYIYGKISQDEVYYKSILKKIKDYKITNAASLRLYLSDKEYEKIAVLKQRKQTTMCAHTQAFAGFYGLLAKQFKDVKEVVQAKIKELGDYVEYDGKVARCKKCKDFLFCKHSIDVVGLAYDEKDKVLEPYKSGVTEGIVFCKYCKEKLLRIHDDTALDANMFNIIAHARALDRENENELPVLREICYTSITHVLASFVFKADVSKAKLQKELMKIITPPVLVQLHKLNLQFDTKEYHMHGRMIAYIYTFVFFMETYLADANIQLRGVEKSQKDYLKHFGSNTMTRYQDIVTDAGQVRKYMLMAHESTKSIDKVKSSYTTRADVAVAIMSTPIYKFLFKLFMMEYVQSNPPVLMPKVSGVMSEAEAYNSIVYVKDAKVESFIYDAYKPVSQFWKGSLYRDSYEYLLGFGSSKCSVHNAMAIEVVPDDLPEYKQSQYDRTLQDKLFAHRDAVNRELLVRHYVTYKKMDFNYADIMARMMPMQYVFDEKGARRQWMVDIKDGKVAGIVSVGSGLKLSDKMPQPMIKVVKAKTLAKHKVAVVDSSSNSSSSEDANVTVNRNRFDVLLRVDKKYDLGKIEFVAQSAGVPYNEFLKGNVIKSDVRVPRLYGYIISLIKNYNSLRFRPALYEHYFEKKDDVLANITYPDIGSQQFLEEYAKVKSMWSANNTYNYLQNYLLSVIEKLVDAKLPVLNKFLLANLNEIFSADYAYSLGTAYQSLNLEVQDQDIIGAEDGEAAADKDDKGFLKMDDIDYEEDEDDIPEIAEMDD